MKVYVDANPKEYAIVFETGKTLHGHFDKKLTNNEAEYCAILAALEEPYLAPMEIMSDSELVVKQLNHVYNINEDRLRVLAIEVWNLVQDKSLHGVVKLTWVPRKENKAGRVLG